MRERAKEQDEHVVRKARKGIPEWLKQIEAIKMPTIIEKSTRFPDFPFVRICFK